MRCPYCNAELSDGANFCTNCGATLNNSNEIVCPSCGTPNSADSPYCQGCGWPLQEEQVPPPINPTPAVSSSSSGLTGTTIAIILVLVGILIAVIVITVNLVVTKDSNPPTAKSGTTQPIHTEQNGSGGSSGSSDNNSSGSSDNNSSDYSDNSNNSNSYSDNNSSGYYDNNDSNSNSSSGVHRYDYFVEDVTWNEAVSKARQKGGHLATIETQQEFDQIASELSQARANGGNGRNFYIGGVRSGGSSYYWADINGNPTSNSVTSASWFWLPGEPTFEDDSTGLSENVLEILFIKDDDRWYVNDTVTNSADVFPELEGKTGYIVEYE